MDATHFEAINATSLHDAMRQFIGRLSKEDELHDYLLDNHVAGLTFVVDGIQVSRGFIDMPADCWNHPYRKSARVARP
jgi:hypothetical protein